MKNTISFDQLGLSEDLQQHLGKIGYHTPTEIQAAAIPELLSGTRDIIGQARTGTGKTAAFSLPILEHIDESRKEVQALILSPTRELAGQIADEIGHLKGKRRIRTLAVYGGQSYANQLTALRKGTQIVAGTPGRIIDLLQRKALSLAGIRYLVLDEADEMLNMGFIDDVETILGFAPEDRRTLLFSATMPDGLRRIADRYLRDKVVIRVTGQEEAKPLTRQVYYSLWQRDKLAALKRVIDFAPEFYGIVFCRTRADADQVNQRLMESGYASEALHGEISQTQREKIIRKFREGHARILVATDVAARGIDIKGLTHVINLSPPADEESYIHRIGRTGRAGTTGTAISLLTPAEQSSRSIAGVIASGDLVQEEPPTVRNILKMKKRGIYEAFRKTLEEQATEEKGSALDQACFGIAKNLLDGQKPTVVLAALLRMAYATELNMENYAGIEEAKLRKRRSGGRAYGGSGRPGRWKSSRGEGRSGPRKGGRKNPGKGRSAPPGRKAAATRRQG